MILPRRKRMSVDEFLTYVGGVPEREELIDGRPAPLAAASLTHDRIAQRVAGALRRQLRGRPWRATRNGPIRIDRWNLLMPDVAVTFRPFDQTQPEPRDPVVVIEVVAPDSEARDRGEKWLRYSALADLQHYLLIASDAHRLELYTRLGPKKWSYRCYEDEVQAVVGLTALDLCLFPAEVYEGVDLGGPAGVAD